MMFDPSKPLELDLLGPSVTALDFLEETKVTTRPRPGWAPPRKRPRRVFKKLAARGFKDRYDGPVMYDGLQMRVTVLTAPRLVAWLSERGDKSKVPLEVRFSPVIFDGRDLPRAVPPELWGQDYLQTAEEPPFPLEPTSADDPPFIERSITTWAGRRIGRGILVDSSWAIAARRVEFYAVVYSPPGVDDRPVKRAIDIAVNAVHKAIILAALGRSSTTLVARQTCYRPVPR
jgi:hypothetical protein